MNFGLMIVGDEILSGKRQDKHFARVVEMLGGRGLALSWVHYLGDDRERLTAALARSFASADAVFCCGGIGATPDDHTRQAAAAALGVELALHPEAARLIAERTAEMAREGRGSPDMSLPENRQRLRMGEFPLGAQIVPNPFNRIPGFAVRNHFFVPGFPVMAWPMIEAVLDARFAHLFHRNRQAERSFLVYELAESTATPLMEEIERDFPGIRVFSLPSMGEDGVRRHIELGVRGPASLVEVACTRLEAGARELGGAIR
ncbi:MAG: competence/damage-inducible protein A [Burkholderiaceae bacterium]|nr:competence/damage-inducible protein A [Burkholderiaceae bacterium]MEB2350397.1 molybdopterin-binding protein [Burkholderiaceae bacterium]